MDGILLAQEVNADWVLIDEKLDRKIAATFGLQVRWEAEDVCDRCD